jgi:PLP dependent protein
MSITANLKEILKRCGPKVKLIVVTKNRTIEEIEEVLKTPSVDIGENRIQEASIKFEQLKTTTQKHLIGHLQSNKVKQAVKLFDMIQSVDSPKLAKKLNEECSKQNKQMPILLQINIANDPNKYGFKKEDLSSIIKEIDELSHLSIKGLMTIVPYVDMPENARPHFTAMKELLEKVKIEYPTIELEELSMGMSHDHSIAIEEGATMIRIGRKIFE